MTVPQLKKEVSFCRSIPANKQAVIKFEYHHFVIPDKLMDLGNAYQILANITKRPSHMKERTFAFYEILIESESNQVSTLIWK